MTTSTTTMLSYDFCDIFFLRTIAGETSFSSRIRQVPCKVVLATALNTREFVIKRKKIYKDWVSIPNMHRVRLWITVEILKHIPFTHIHTSGDDASLNSSLLAFRRAGNAVVLF
jgi:hypothetical protein